MSTPQNNKDFVAISINDSSVSYPPSSKLYCNLCSCNLILLDGEKEEWFCTRCHVTDKHGNITGEKMPLISMADDTPKLKDTMPRYFKEMERHGLKITSFTTTEER